MKTIGFLVNPIAGLGGQAGMKGSDSAQAQALARQRGYEKTAERRACECLRLLKGEEAKFLTPAGEMGARALEQAGLAYQILGEEKAVTTREDTLAYAKALRQAGAELLVFCGGDGTGRDVCEAVGSEFPVLGVPSGVKMYSACFAGNPRQAGELLRDYARGRKLSFGPREVMDLEEADLDNRSVSPRLYGFLMTPDDGVRLQRAKEAGYSDAEDAEALADYLLKEMKKDTLYIIGPGGTTGRLKERLEGKGTIRGVDLARNGQILAADVDEKTIYAMLEEEGRAEIIVTCIGGNGFLFGRGNQQISPRIIRKVTKDHIRIAVTRAKLAGLGGRPLRVDTGEPQTDRYLAGYYRIPLDRQETVIYQVAAL